MKNYISHFSIRFLVSFMTDRSVLFLSYFGQCANTNLIYTITCAKSKVKICFLIIHTHTQKKKDLCQPRKFICKY